MPDHVPERIAILGSGSWGTALATLLWERQCVRLWAREPGLARDTHLAAENRRYLPGVSLPGNVECTADLAYSLDRAGCVVFAVPSAAMAEVAAMAAPLVPGEALVVSAAKGLQEENGARMSEVIGAALDGATVGGAPAAHRIAALSGPNLAMEVARGLPSASVAASLDSATAEACQALWMRPMFRVYTCDDIIGVELAGAMKNVIAIGAGVCEGLGLGDNSRSALMTRGLAEITRLGATLGARPATFLGLAGVGDLIATGSSKLSRNYRVGLGLGQGKALATILSEIGQVAEGVPTTRAICALARRVGVEMPISDALYSALFDGDPAVRVLERLMSRPPRGEANA